MTKLSIEAVGCRSETGAAVPTIVMQLRATVADGVRVRALALRCQVRIEPRRRHYDHDEEGRLYELFGDLPQWGTSLSPFLWTHASTVASGFDGSTTVDLPISCTYDFEVAGTKYLHALTDGEVPLVLLFSGTVFTDGSSGFTAEPVPWDLQTSYRMPVSVWREMMDQYFPNSGWIRVGRPTLDLLQRFKTAHALPSWDQAFERLLKEAGEGDL